ncbi:NADPH-dependent FMN reductase [Micromonospora sp. NPDC049903]|uniref:NADPH-dependent FMN reductase n=1 Tax=Micromonospora sp. NPDC049903 TaxID=3364276 RepID=UPI0037A8805C
MDSAQREERCRIGVVLGSSRPGRRGAAVAGWVTEVAAGHPSVRSGATAVDVIDLAEQQLPMLDEPFPALFGDAAGG